MKLTVEDQELRQKLVEYLAVNGTEVDDNTPIAITLPGAGAAPQRCMSGSGKMTSGGKFAPGFDAKLKSALYSIIRGVPEKIPAELQENGPMYIPVAEWTPEKATEVLNDFNWPLPTIKPPKEKKEKAESNGDGEPKTRAGRKRSKEGEAETAGEAEVQSEEVTSEPANA